MFHASFVKSNVFFENKPVIRFPSLNPRTTRIPHVLLSSVVSWFVTWCDSTMSYTKMLMEHTWSLLLLCIPVPFQTQFKSALNRMSYIKSNINLCLQNTSTLIITSSDCSYHWLSNDIHGPLRILEIYHKGCIQYWLWLVSFHDDVLTYTWLMLIKLLTVHDCFENKRWC